MSGLVPSRIAPLLSTGLLSMRGRARAALELLVPRREGDDDESIADFARRRFGVEAYDWLIEPLLGGIHAGDGEALSLPSTFPQLARLERQRGSVLRAMLAPRFARSAGNGAANPGFLTLPEGLGGIVAGLERRLGDSVRRGARVTAVQPRPGGFDVILAGGELVRAEAVVVTAPAHAAADLLAAGDPALARELRGIPFVSTATVSLAFDEAAVPPLPPGYGYVSARAEGGAVVACSWTSRKFPARTPAGRVLLRLFVGRAGNEGAAHLDDGALLDLARAELRAVLNITAAPVLARVFRWPRAMPQYVLGHGARLARIDGLLARWPGLLLAGASYRGAGIPDCVASGWAAADAAAPVLAAGSGVAAPAGAA
jgi:oxygen-dependent protoporphyrinogen oxidase